jgi:predicted permease
MRWWQIGKRDADLERELQSDLELEEDEQRENGLSPEEAHYAARRALGNTVLIREQTHEAWGWAPLEHLWQDLRYGLRQLRRSPGFAVAVVATLALGIGATTAIFTIVYSTLLRSLPYPESNRIVRIHDVRLQGRSTAGLVSVPRFFDLATRSKSFSSTGFFFFDDTTLVSGTHLPVAVKAAGVNADFWRVFGVGPLLGRTFDQKDDQPNASQVTVLSYGTWKRIFGGNPAIIGQQITIEKTSTTIIGVMPKEFSVPNGIDLWRAAQFVPGDWQWRGEGTRFLNVVVRLSPGISIASAQNDLQRIGEQLRSEHAGTDSVWQFNAVGMRDDLYGGLRPALLLLFIASGFLLLVACINVANLLLAKATAREREVALRRALGATERRIQLQFFTEATLLSVTGGFAGLGLAFLLVRMLAGKLPGRLGAPGAVEMNWPGGWFAFALAVACGVGFGFAPAIRNRRTALNVSLKQREIRSGGRRTWTRYAFISAQVAISLILLIGASLLGASLWNLVKSPLGFIPEHVLTFRLALPWDERPDAIRDFYFRVQQRLEILPGVTAVGQISALPTEDWNSRSSFDADWLPRTNHRDAVNAEVRSTAGSFLRALGTPLLVGRELVPKDDLAKPLPVMVNRAFAQQYLPEGSPIGRHILDNTESMEIVGVIADVRGTGGSIARKAGPEIYFPANGIHPNMRRSFIVRSQIPPEQLIPMVRDAVYEVDPQQAIANVATMDELLDKAVAQPRLNMALIAVFAVLALLLACVGIYSIVTWTVAQRVREIGVRMALGASRSQIARFFLDRVIRAAILGIVTGTTAALVLTHLLRSQLYGVTPANPWVYVISIPLLLLPVLIATLRPALRAASINPVDALRAD